MILVRKRFEDLYILVILQCHGAEVVAVLTASVRVQ